MEKHKLENITLLNNMNNEITWTEVRNESILNTKTHFFRIVLSVVVILHRR